MRPFGLQVGASSCHEFVRWRTLPPDGSKIVFESDRSGSQQIYVMNADGTNQQRVSFFGGRAATSSPSRVSPAISASA